MADGDDKQFPATPKKRAEARKNGQVARSPEFSGAMALLAITLVLHVTLPGYAGTSLLQAMRSAFLFNPTQTQFDYSTVAHWQHLTLLWAARLVLPVMLLALILGLAVNIGQVGLRITPEALAPKWDRLNPIQGFKRLFSMQGVVEVVKGIGKMAIVGGICYTTLRTAINSGGLMDTMQMPLPASLSMVGQLMWTLGIRVAATFFLLAVADFAWQKHDFEKNLKMSASDIKQEMKQSDGDPQVKARIRRLQREMAKRRMMQEVPKADVVITNPTHFAIALKYEDGAAAPRVVAKGQDEVAQKIKEIARENNVPLVENRPLARTLFATVEIGGWIPPDLYEAVAQVLAFVYRTYGRRTR